MRIARGVIGFAMTLGVVCASARTAHASPGPAGESETAAPRGETISMSRSRLVWDERWHRFRPIEYATTAVTGAGALYFLAVAKPSDHPKWDGPILFDEPVRDTIRLRTTQGLTTWTNVGDVLSLTVISQVVVLDGIVLPLAARNPDLAFQLTLINTQVFAASGLVLAGLYTTTGRARPSYRECLAQRSNDPTCGRGSFTDFPSGHAGTAFAAAGLACATHRHVPLYGGGAWDVAACVEALLLATGSSTIRLMADRHWASDVIVGGGIGFLLGYGLPTLLHFGFRGRSVGMVVDRPYFKVGLAPGVAAGGVGAMAVGVF
jgi:membrane-associated phospholipid phosphatase